MRGSAHTKITKANMAPIKQQFICSILVPDVFFPSYNKTHCCRFKAFVRILHLESFKMQKIRKKSRNFAGFSPWL